MHVCRGSIAKQLLQPDLPLGGVHDVDATHDFRDALEFVVDDHGELVGDQAVAASNDKVAGFALEPLRLRTLEPVDKCDRLVVGAYADRRIVGLAAVAAGARVDDAERSARGLGKVLA